jgi:hypothetical protein
VVLPCPDCHQQGITPAILDTLLRQDLQQQGLDRPVLKDQREIMEDKAAGLDGQLVLLNVLQDSMADRRLSGKLRYLPLEQRKTARRPLLLEVEGFAPAHITVGKAQQATRSRLSINLSPARDTTLPLLAPVAFVAARDMAPPSPAITPLLDSYELSTRQGLEALYQDAFGVLPALPKEGQPLEWIPDLQWVLDRQTSPTLIDPLTPDSMQLLFSAVDIQGCFRVADPVAQSPLLVEALQQRYKRPLLKSSPTNPPHPANWLSPGYYRHLAVKGPVDWAFLYPPLSIADLALAVAMNRARVGVALWVPRAYLSNLSSIRLSLLTSLKAQRRLVIVQSWADPYLWVCCFTSAAHRNRMLCPDSAAATAWTSI